MSNLISNADKALFTGSYNDFFDTFKKQIVIYKEPIKVATSVSSQSLYGYETESNETNYTYTPVSGIYYGIVSNRPAAESNEQVKEANISFNGNSLHLKVEKNARDFILNDKTERIEIEGHNYNLTSKDKRVSFLSKDFYLFNLEEMY